MKIIKLLQLSGTIIWLAPFQTMTGEALESILHLEDQISCFSTSPNNKSIFIVSAHIILIILTILIDYT